MNTLGWLGGILLAGCAIPEVFCSWRTKTCNISHGMLWTWYLGEIFIVIPVVAKGMDGFLIFNYLANVFMISILIYYKYNNFIKKQLTGCFNLCIMYNNIQTRTTDE